MEQMESAKFDYSTERASQIARPPACARLGQCILSPSVGSVSAKRLAATVHTTPNHGEGVFYDSV